MQTFAFIYSKIAVLAMVLVFFFVFRKIWKEEKEKIFRIDMIGTCLCIATLAALLTGFSAMFGYLAALGLHYVFFIW